ncbi:expressed unknown protein [Seminavis robusta]|uniref:HPt domain-containing protein n=1 Tax=Seminavis robusta TaxID=568900 RepID=A0A9N8HB04_9STRA|nr:expressed unknown protein [Seminavis robusta]|eukprot:Sro166_g074060.1 n/a (131) ;mRNA; f:15640-16159
MSGPPPDVIDWTEAMQQTGDDEEFLRELLADLRQETDTQVSNIEQIIQNPTDAPFQRIQRAAHVIKGASANLMCAQLRYASMALEQTAQAAHNENNGSPSAETTQKVQQCYLDLKRAQENYHGFLNGLGV